MAASAAYIIRERHDTDVSALAAVLVRVHARDGYPVEGVADPLAWLVHPHALKSWTALVGNVPIGQVTLTDADSADDAFQAWAARTGGSSAALAIIARLFVDHDYRQTGAGRSLVLAALDYARSIGRSVALDVMTKDVAAIRLYERLGGRRIGEVTHKFGAGLNQAAVVFDFPEE